MAKTFFIHAFAAAMLLTGMLLPATTFAQLNAGSEWYWGLGGGYRVNHVSFSDLNKTYFPTNKLTGSGLFSVFVQGEFGRNGNFAIRPQISLLNRGGKLTEILQSTYQDYTDPNMEDINYRIIARYVDIRVPLIYNFGNYSSHVRPYVYLAPVAGFTTGGNIRLQAEYDDKSIAGYQLDVSDANMASTYLAGQVGAGLKFAIPVAQSHFYLGIEASYEYGITNTYGKKEKDSEANDVAQLFNTNYKLNGNRKFSGVETQATLSVPFDIFKSKTPEPEPQTYVAPKPKPTEVKEEKPCYTLEEVIDLMAKNEDVTGKTICAVDAITFDFSKSTIKPESYEYLDKLAETFILANKRVEVKGHTDDVGSDEFNMNLSRERAEAVVDYLVSKGVNRNKLTYSYYGKTQPLASNDTEEGRAQNRRVEFTILNNF